MELFTVAFFGHRYVDNILAVEDKLEDIILSLMREKEYVDFVVGRNGDFDQCVSSTVLRCKKKYRYDNNSLVLVLPYATAKYANNQEYFEEYYDDIEVSYTASKPHPKAVIKIRNREMVDRADLIVCFIERESGGECSVCRNFRKTDYQYCHR